jgi:hypothetical protein
MSTSHPQDPLLVVFQPGASFTQIVGAGSTSTREANWSTGYSFTGGLQNFVAHGHGSQTNPRGDIYTGQWAYGKANGIGTYVDRDGHTYRGGWLNGLQDGVGVTVTSMGDRDVSGWLEGKKHGYGTTRSNGDAHVWKHTYTGGLKNGDYWGWGQKVLSDGNKYIGGFKNNEYWGYGTIYSPEGRKKCEGGFKGYNFHGHIVVTEKLFEELERPVIRERFYENGVVRSPPSAAVGMAFPEIDLQTKMEGAIYHNDSSHTPFGTITWPEPGRYYDGALDGGYPHGYGTITYVTGGQQYWYEGGWDYGRASGYGEYTVAATGDRYAGGFKDGKLHGFGQVRKTVLQVTMWTETFWKNGVQVG